LINQNNLKINSILSEDVTWSVEDLRENVVEIEKVTLFADQLEYFLMVGILDSINSDAFDTAGNAQVILTLEYSDDFSMSLEYSNYTKVLDSDIAATFILRGILDTVIKAAKNTIEEHKGKNVS